MNREATLKKAEQLLRDGKLDPAIDEYLRLIQQYPRDWGAVNALGDLYLRAGRNDLAMAQFTRVADYLFDEGFLPKAQAVYKKTLKIQGGDEHTLRRLAEIATKQGLLADARHYQRQLGALGFVDENPSGATDDTVATPASPARDAHAQDEEPAEPPQAAEGTDSAVMPAADPVTAAAPPDRADPVTSDSIPGRNDSISPDIESDCVLEVDLSDALTGIDALDMRDVAIPPSAKSESPPAQPPQSLTSVFAALRTAATFEQQEMTAAAHYDLATRYLEASRWEDAISELQSAARAPAMRFVAGAQLGRVLLGRGLIQEGIDWLERAVEAPAPDAKARALLMYELADALEGIHESERALAILMELDAEVPHFSDVADRIARLKRVVAGR